MRIIYETHRFPNWKKKHSGFANTRFLDEFTENSRKFLSRTFSLIGVLFRAPVSQVNIEKIENKQINHPSQVFTTLFSLRLTLRTN